ncbi:hypothetical protein [Microvirga massiliensis]|uniref:hypothetical protein n=1 Tax=Microvirga massiliensis TaxID=1033741 RepID=UPI00062B5093|nr:hypothetical protein [Microvirga massiliensis]
MTLPLTAPLPLPTPLDLPGIQVEMMPGGAILWHRIIEVRAVRVAWRSLSLALQHPLLRQASVYVLAGLAPVQEAEDDAPVLTLHFYTGEVGRPPRRLPDHRRSPAMAFVETMYLLTSRSFNKADVIYLQERVAALVRASGQGIVVQGCAPVSQPIMQCDAEALDLGLGFGLTLLQAAGCPWVEL